jgi:hypothetical protein
MRSAAAAAALIKLNDSIAAGVKPLTLSCGESRSGSTMNNERRFPKRVAAELPVDEIAVAGVEQSLLEWIYRRVARHWWILHVGEHRLRVPVEHHEEAPWASQSERVVRHTSCTPVSLGA